MLGEEIMADKKKANLEDIKLLVLDVDGVMTDGTIIINGDGSESKFFNTLDGSRNPDVAESRD